MSSQPKNLSEHRSGDSPQVDWLKADLFEDIVKSKIKNFRKINNLKASPALSSGENYASNVWRIEIEIELSNTELRKLSYILKLPKNNELFEDIEGKHNAFTVELGMYRDILPQLQKLYEEVGCDIQFCASGYKLSTPNVHILFDDLRPEGFKVADRLAGLNVEQVRFVLKKLAYLHAASAKFVEIHGPYDKMYADGFFTEEGRPFIAEIKHAMGQSFLNCAEDYANNEAYIESVQNLQAKFVEEFYKTIEVDAEEFNVLNHGDCWTNNLMFQYDELDHVTETFFIDFQIPKYGSPAQDLLYFLMSSPKLELKLKKFDHFISYYHEHLTAALSLLKYERRLPSLSDLHCTLFKRGFWGYEAATGALGAVLVQPTKLASFENFYSKSKEGEDFRKLMYSNEKYVKHMEQILPWLLYRGALECTTE